MAPMDAEKKAALLAKLKAGREKTKAARAEGIYQGGLKEQQEDEGSCS